MRRALLYSVFTALGLVGGLLYQIVLASTFGAGREMDILFASSTWPQFLETVILGSIGFVLIPRLVRADEAGPGLFRATAWQVTVLTTGLFLGVALPGMLLAHPLIHWTNPGFKNDEVELGTRLIRFHWLNEVLMAARVCLTSVAVARGRLGRAGLAPVAGSLGSIVALLLLVDRIGITAGAVGMVVSTLIQCAILWPFGVGPWPSLAGALARFAELSRDLAPFVAGAAYARTDTAVDRLLASFLSGGAITYLAYGNRLVVSLSALAVAGVTAVWLPEMSRHTIETGHGRLQELFLRGLKALLLVCLFIACLMPFFSNDLLSLLFRRGAFSAADVAALSNTVLALSGLFLAGSFASLTSSCFYSQGETRVPNVIGAIAYTIAVGLRLAGVHFYGFLGIALATSAGAILSLAMQLWVIRSRWRLFSWAWLGRHVLLYGGAGALCAGLAGAATMRLAPLPHVVLGSLLATILYATLLVLVTGELPKAARTRRPGWLGGDKAS